MSIKRTWRVESIRSEDELPGFARVMAESFGGTAETARYWSGRTGFEKVRVVRDGGGEVVAGLVVLPIGVWLGGRCVASTGISAVVVAPHVRGQGVAKALMLSALKEAQAARRPLSTLYPATLSLYRAVGYGQAGTFSETRVPLDAIGALADAERALPVRRFREQDAPALESLFARVAARRHGWVQRDAVLWGRVAHSRAGEAERYLIGEEGAPEAHVAIMRVLHADGWLHDLRLMDATVDTPRAARRLWAFLASHGSVVKEVSWSGGANDPLLAMLPEPRFAVRLSDMWMARVVDVPGALGGRGYRPDVRARLELELDDPQLPENAGRWVLEVEAGRARVERGGDGALKLGPEGLGGLITGFRSVQDLEWLGLASATPEAREAADALFSGPPPQHQDRY
jgi:predicted acetyltransferase